MDAKMLRLIGVAFGAAALATAIATAALTGRPAPPAPEQKPPVAGPLERAPAAAPAIIEAPEAPGRAAAPALAEPALADGPAMVEASFVVRFRSSHPLSRAQRLAAEGQSEEAERLARGLVASRREFRGLCFDRFTLGGAEIVLASCARLAEGEGQSFIDSWLARFNSMAGVEYASANLIADPDSEARR